MTPSLAALIERVEKALERFEAARIADLDWPTRVSIEPSDLRALLNHLRAHAAKETI